MVDNTVDYLVIGGGSAGCVMATRLVERTGMRVAVLEAGPGSGPDVMYSGNPLDAMGLWRSPVDWAFNTTAQAGLDGAVLGCPRGKVLGGSSSINGLVHLRGHASSYDAWEQHGAIGWNYQTMLPYLKRSERADGRDPEVRGTAGPMRVGELPAANSLAQAVYQAMVDAGYPESADPNGREAEGVSWLEQNVVANKRQSAADAYLGAVLSEPNLTVVTDAYVRQLVMDGSRCRGARYTKDGHSHDIYAEREVIVCAGAIGSPKVLMLSGIGPAEQLRKHGVPVVVDLPGVGENLHDHPFAWVSYSAMRSAEETPFRRPHLLTRSDEHAEPDVLVIFAEAAIEPHWQGASPGLSVAFSVVRPMSRGSVRLGGPDPFDSPLIDPGYLREQIDIDRMVVALRLARDIAHSAALTPWRGTELLPGAEVRSDEECRAFLRRSTDSFFHLAGTCRIGTDDLAVVDPELRVRGVEGLRVVDASVMPSLVSAPTNAAVLGIAERAAELIAPGGALDTVVPQASPTRQTLVG
ncbi:GMC family oxidoreductase N-terminal domain-containing protein [Mycobacterium sp. Aquia_216]|uniref:GMC family oxidoreductase n=1 Tax=Mycobacterium sp. Aquia_216 TaxID=2991729 RepID=UPI00227B8AFA|nr:GMC family oxidoreductase N-terminal domain-containing protein [Mycobacterium sp. Aquia_216]WAJ42528.1 GMC family oxidoreductase N-terminal domain-containing protein [Mycobacterium sp. Aquia_216]